MMTKKTILVKIGGRMANSGELLAAFTRELGALAQQHDFVLVHGGGREVSELSEKLLGKPAVFKDGIRQTSPDEMDIVEMVLCGRVNKRLVRLFQSAGVNAVGLSGSDARIFLGQSLGNEAQQRTGGICAVDPKGISLLLQNGYLPVLSSTTMDASGNGININADEAALAIAVALKADVLLYLSDIAGVLKDGKVIAKLLPVDAKREIEAGVISGGMIPKVQSSLGACERGVTAVIIGEYGRSGALAETLDGRLGTAISLK